MKCPGSQLFIVGDIHGCALELQRLLEQERFDAIYDTLVLVGDLVNRGPQSGEVVKIVREMGALCVRGNHDDELLEAWFRVGRFANGLEKYRHDALYQVSRADVHWIQELPLSLSFPWLSLLVVHAGLLPGVPLCQQRFRDLLWIRDVMRACDAGDCGGSAWVGLEAPTQSSLPWARIWEGPEHVVFGHDAKRHLQKHSYATGLDSGCVYGHHLTALIVDPLDFSKRRFASVPAERVYTAPKNGQARTTAASAGTTELIENRGTSAGRVAQ